jgi:hypothetical protein
MENEMAMLPASPANTMARERRLKKRKTRIASKRVTIKS